MKRPAPLKAAAWMMGAVLSFVAMAVAGRVIQTEMNTFELMLYRSVIGLILVVTVICLRPERFAAVRSQRPWLHVRRNVFQFAGQNLWFFALVLVPLGQLAALEFTSPIWVTLLAPFLLGERLTRTRLFAVACCFVGVLIVAQPGTGGLGIGHLSALCAALCFALHTIYTRQIMNYDGILSVLFWMTLSQTGMSLVLALPGGIPLPSPALVPWLVVVGITGVGAHFSLTSALRHAPASMVAPMEYMRLPVLVLVGAWLYGEPLHLVIFAGAALIIAGNYVNMRAEARQAAM